eukprot:14941076-Heterocapsa_arctica.AAC.1
MLIRSFRQEELAKKSQTKAISARGKPQEDGDIWDTKFKDCCDWESQELIDIGEEMAAIGERRNCDVTQERCESWRKWSAEAMDN